MASKSVKFFVLGGVAVSMSMLAASNVSAQAHVHGAGELLIAQEYSQWQFEFRLPAADLLGFEHAPETQAQKDKLQLVGEQINDVSKVIALPSFCELTDYANSLDSLASVETGDHAHGDHEHDHGNHSHDEHKHDEHDHGDHKHEEHDHGDHKHEKHDHDKHKHDHDHNHSHEDHAGHADITMTYVFECKDDLTQAQVTIFSITPSLQTIQAQWITNKGQGAQETSESAAILRF